MKNNILDISRLWMLLKKSFLERKRVVFYEILGIAAIILGIFGLTALSGNVSGEMQQLLFAFAIYFLGILVADRAFSDTKSRVKGMFYLMSPASKLEKLLAAIIVTSVVYPLVFIVLFFAVDVLVYLGLSATGLVTMAKFPFAFGGLLNGIKYLLIFQSVYMLGSIWFKKRSFLKTTSAIVGYYALIVIVMVILFVPAFTDMKGAGGEVYMDSSFQLDLAGNNFGINGYITNTVQWLLIPFFWTISYFKISEKQI